VSAVPSLFCVGGTQLTVAVPLVGVGVPALAITAIEKGASVAFVRPSVTLIVMLENVPTLDAVGVPVSFPVDVLKLAHAGLFEIWK
jgi:hypothetical protein